MKHLKKIVVASSDKEFSHILNDLLKDLNCELFFSDNYEDLTNELIKENIAVFLIDADTANYNDWELSEELQENILSNLPVILTSTPPIKNNLVELMKKSCVNEYVREPIDYPHLKDVIKQFLLAGSNIPEDYAEDDKQIEQNGNLEEIPFPRMLYLIRRELKTGTLTLSHGKTTRVIYFEEGEPKRIVSNIIQECLGNIMLAKGKINFHELETSLILMKKWKKKQGETLIKMGLLKPHELDEMLRTQARERILECFFLHEGTYQFSEERLLSEDLTLLDMSIPQIVLSGVRRYYTLELLKKFLDKFLDHIPSLNLKSLYKVDDFKLSSWDLKFINLIDGKRNFQKILDIRKMRTVNLYSLLFCFYCFGIVRFWDPKTLKDRQKKLLDSIKFHTVTRKNIQSFHKSIISGAKSLVIPSPKEKKTNKSDSKPVEATKISKGKRLTYILSFVLLILAGLTLLELSYLRPNSLLNDINLSIVDSGKTKIIKSAKVENDVLSLVSVKGWNISRNKHATRKLLENIFYDMKVQKIKKIKLADQKGKLLGILISKSKKDKVILTY